MIAPTVKQTSHYTAVIHSPLGKIGLAFEQDKLTALNLLPDATPLQAPVKGTPANRVMQELTAYFKDASHAFNLDFLLAGTDFQKRVWHALQKIPQGYTLTYGALAKQLKTSPRAIGQACRTNPIPVIIPCHRIVAATHLGGYSGARNGRWLEVKTWLLRHEGYVV